MPHGKEIKKLTPEQRKQTIITDAGGYPEQARRICDLLGATYGERECSYFPDTDPYWRSKINLRGRDVILHQPIGLTADASMSDNLIRLLAALDAIGRASADKIQVVIPYFPGRQDRKHDSRESILARLIMDQILLAGGRRLRRLTVVMLHSPQEQGFLPPSFPADPLFTGLLLMDYYAKWYLERDIKPEDLCLVGPDVSMDKLVRQLAPRLGKGVTWAVIDKKRVNSRDTAPEGMFGKVDGKHCLIFDDEISTFGTGDKGVWYLKEMGALSVSMAVTHGKFADDPRDLQSRGAIDRIEKSGLKHLAFIDTLPWRFNFKPPEMIHIIDGAPFLADVISRTVNNESLAALWEGIKI